QPNNGNGVHISGALSTGNLVQQGFIENNAGDGVLIDTGASNNTVGGFTSSPVDSGNTINHNNGSGVHLNNSSGDRIQRNFIGTDVLGTSAIGNAAQGSFIEYGSANSIVGGNHLSAGNKIAGNSENGIYDLGVTSSGNQLQSN